MNIRIREYQQDDLIEMISIWNEVIEDGLAFPGLEYLTIDTGIEFFRSQSFTAVAELEDNIIGLYILHPNNIGRCGHIANASYAVKKQIRGKKVGEKLVRHSLEKAKKLDFKLMQFNAVVKTNVTAIHLYEKLGFHRLGIIPGGFLNKDNTYEDIILYYYEL